MDGCTVEGYRKLIKESIFTLHVILKLFIISTMIQHMSTGIITKTNDSIIKCDFKMGFNFDFYTIPRNLSIMHLIIKYD